MIIATPSTDPRDREYQDKLYENVVLCIMPKINGSGLYGPGIKNKLQNIIICNINTSLVKRDHKVEDYAEILAEVSKNSWIELKRFITAPIQQDVKRIISGGYD